VSARTKMWSGNDIWISHTKATKADNVKDNSFLNLRVPLWPLCEALTGVDSARVI
jgi:hypothetical protein